MANDKPNNPSSTKRGTLSLGGTLSVGGSGGTGNAPRPAAQSAAPIAVEVRRRRFDAPSPLSGQRPIGTAKATSEEMERRMQALQNAQAQGATKPKEDPLQLAMRLQEERIREAAEKARLEAERKEAERLEQEAAAAEKARAKEQARSVSQNKAGSGAGGVQSGTMSNTSAGRSVNSREFTGKSETTTEADNKRKSEGRSESRGDRGEKRGGRNAYLEELAERQRSMSGAGRRRRGQSGPMETTSAPQEKLTRDVSVPEFITVGDLASRMAEKASDVVKKLMMMGEMVTVNQTIDQDTAELIVGEFGHRVIREQAINLEQDLLEADDAADALQGRPPVVTIMGHVDHGKTTLLDTLRKTQVAKGEAGGITQHIGAYQIKAPSGRLITFLDTPGHAAFTAMRARGAQVTDVVILVVAADDGIMPQTIEAIQHARAAGVPMVVALNKMDKPTANPQKVKTELLAHEVMLEEFGGDVPVVPVSGLTGMGLDELEEVVLLQADVLDLKANPNRRADGAVVEARLDKGRGSVATVIVQRGTLRVGDIVVAGSVWGRVRALINDRGENVTEAGPAMPVEILGLGGVPAAGDQFIVAADERKAREAAQWRETQQRERQQAARKLTLENMMERLSSGDMKDLNLIIKADVQGSLEAIQYALNQLNEEQEQVRVKVISTGVGVITENDVNLAATAGALIVGFNVRADATARETAERNGIALRYESIIYNLVDDIKAAMTGLLAPTKVEEVLGQAEIRAVFTFDKLKIAGCMATSGKIVRGSKIRLIRDGVVVHTGDLGTLRRAKDDVKEVASGYECGMTFTNYTDFKEGDVVECFHLKEVKRTIDDLMAAGAKA